MKHRVLSLSILVFFALVFAACGGTASRQKELVTMNCLVNGANWRCAEPTATVSDKRIKINGTSANGQTIILNINSGELGEFIFSLTNGHYAEFIPNMSQSSQDLRFSTLNGESGSGVIRLTSLNTETKTLGGEFSFRALKYDGSVRTISEGKFSNVPYSYYDFGEEVYPSKFKFSYNNINWDAAKISATKTDTAIIIKGDCDQAQAWQGITLQFPPDLSAGVHYFGDDIKGTFQSGFYNFPAITGAITISENNPYTKVAKGTFFFNYSDNNANVQSITDGSFDVKYTDLTVIE